MRKTAAAIVIVTVFVLGGLGGYVLHGQGQIVIFSSGAESCGEWLADRRQGQRSDVVALKANWINGYLTGIQDGMRQGLTERQSRDIDGRSAWIDNYCEDHPLDDLKTAAAALYLELLSL